MADAQAPTQNIGTGTDQSGGRWGINDVISRLRAWASDITYDLPPASVDILVGSQEGRPYDLPPASPDVLVGNSEDCLIQVADRLVSREHVRLTCIDHRWFGQDLSKNGTWLDGVRARTFALDPGCEMRVGGSTLVAESPRFIELRFFIGRILGWSNDRLEAVDLALRAIRNSALRRSTLYFDGDTDLVPIARTIHRHVWGPHLPFVVCDPRRGDAGESARSAANKPTGLEAYAAARGGTLCVRGRRLPSDFPELLRRLRNPASSVLLVILGDGSGERFDADIEPSPTICVPGLGERTDELDQVIDEFAIDAARELCLPTTHFAAEDRMWVLEHAAASLSEIEKATMRLIALRASRNLSDAAVRLRMAPVSLTRWLGRRSLPPLLESKLRSSDA